MKSTSTGRWLFILLLGLAAVSISSRESNTAPQTQDSQRKLVSDDFVKNRREGVPSTKSRAAKRRRTYRLMSNPAAEARSRKFAQLGITIWRLRAAPQGNPDRRALVREKNGKQWTAVRVEGDVTFREGDYVRLSVESPRTGYLYVLDRDLFSDGTTGDPMLIFPWIGADNKLFPGGLIDIPEQEDDPSYFTARLSGPNQAGELLTFIVTNTPLDLPVTDKPLRISPKDLSDWEKSWGGVAERYEMEGGAGELWTQEEQQSASKDRRRQLTRDDPAPQTIYRVFTSNNKGMLVNFVLKYGK
jgi:hypothetical protein